MPKVDALGDSKKRAEKIAKQDNAIRAALGSLERGGKMSVAAIARKLDISRSTLYSRMKNPGTFTLDDLRAINKMLENQNLPTMDGGILQ